MGAVDIHCHHTKHVLVLVNPIMPGGSLIVPAHIPQGSSLKSRHQLRQTPRRGGDALQLQLAVADTDAGLNYGQQENSDGNVVTGEYRVLLPDGRTQIVRYRADHESGYVAEVTYEGEARPYVAPAKPAYPAPASPALL